MVMFKKKSIFKTKSINTDKETKMLNRNSIQENYYTRVDKCMKKYMSEPIPDSDLRMYKKLLVYEIIPDYTLCKDGSMDFNLNDMVSLRTFLTRKKFNFSILIHELFSFVSKFKMCQFRHGNLNLDNIFVKYNDSSCCEFRVIDFLNDCDDGDGDCDITTLRQVLHSYYKSSDNNNKLAIIFS